MEQRIAALEAKLVNLTNTFVKFMNVPYKNQKEFITRLLPLLEMYEAKKGPFVEKAKVTRRALTKADWMRVQGCLNDNDEATSWKDVSTATDIPVSTVRRYAKMTPEEVAALPEGITFEETNEDE
jgi:hypothetical protein